MEFDLNFYRGKRVLVTGHTGFKGSWLCQLLHRLGADVTGYSLAPTTNPALFEIAGIDKVCHSVIGDIRDFDHAASRVQITAAQAGFFPFDFS